MRALSQQNSHCHAITTKLMLLAILSVKIYSSGKELHCILLHLRELDWGHFCLCQGIWTVKNYMPKIMHIKNCTLESSINSADVLVITPKNMQKSHFKMSTKISCRGHKNLTLNIAHFAMSSIDRPMYSTDNVVNTNIQLLQHNIFCLCAALHNRCAASGTKQHGNVSA